MEIENIHMMNMLQKTFKIDLIVWKLLNVNVIIRYHTTFKIDLIVWKSNIQ